MSIFDDIINIIGGLYNQGASVVSDIIAQAPTTSTGSPYITPGTVNQNAYSSTVSTVAGSTAVQNIPAPSSIPSSGPQLPNIIGAALSVPGAILGAAVGAGAAVGGAAYRAGADYGRAMAVAYGAPLQTVTPSPTTPSVLQQAGATGTHLPADNMSIGSNAGTVTAFVPYGHYSQIKIENAKLAFDVNTGELGIYQKPYGHSIYNLVGGGGRNALQSGMFTINEPETPFVSEQWASTVPHPSGEGLSRLGAEAYGGYVMPLDSRTIASTNAQLSTYANPNNLANYVNPEGPNLGKAAAPGAAIPWSILPNAPAIQYVNERGIIPGYAAIPSLPTSVTPVAPTVKTTQTPTGVWSPFAASAATGTQIMTLEQLFSPEGASKLAALKPAVTETTTTTTTSPNQYVYRNDTTAVILEGALFFGDALTFGLWKPGAGLLAEKGQTTTPLTPSLDAFNRDMATIRAQEGTYAQLQTQIEGKQAALSSFASGKINAQGQFIGTPEEYERYKGMLGDLNTDVSNYNQFNTKQQAVINKGYASGAIMPTTGGGYTVNPEATREYGAFTEWNRGAGRWIQSALGKTPSGEAQFLAYEQTPEFKNAGPIMQIGEGGYKVLATNPASIGASILQGVEMYVGMGLLTLGFGALAPAAGATPASLWTPAGVTQAIGTTGLWAMANPYINYAVAGGFIGSGIWSATGGGTLPASQAYSNIGGMSTHLVAMGWGAMAPAAPEMVKAAGFRVLESDIMPNIPGGETMQTASYRAVGMVKTSGAAGQIEEVSTVFGGIRTTAEGRSLFFGKPEAVPGEFAFKEQVYIDKFGVEHITKPTFKPNTPLDTYMVKQLSPADQATKIDLGLDVRGRASFSGVELKEITPAIQTVLEGHEMPQPRAVAEAVTMTMKEYNAKLYGSAVQHGVGEEIGIETLGTVPKDLDVMLPGRGNVQMADPFARDMVSAINRAAGEDIAILEMGKKPGEVPSIKVGNQKLFDIHNVGASAEELALSGSPSSVLSDYIGLGMKTEKTVMTKEGGEVISYSEQIGRKLSGTIEYTPEPRTVVSKEILPTGEPAFSVTGELAPKFEGRVKDIGHYYRGEMGNIRILEQSPNPITRMEAAQTKNMLETWLDLWGPEAATYIRGQVSTGGLPMEIDFAEVGSALIRPGGGGPVGVPMVLGFTPLNIPELSPITTVSAAPTSPVSTPFGGVLSTPLPSYLPSVATMKSVATLASVGETSPSRAVSSISTSVAQQSLSISRPSASTAEYYETRSVYSMASTRSPSPLASVFSVFSAPSRGSPASAPSPFSGRSVFSEPSPSAPSPSMPSIPSIPSRTPVSSPLSEFISAPVSKQMSSPLSDIFKSTPYTPPKPPSIPRFDLELYGGGSGGGGFKRWKRHVEIFSFDVGLPSVGITKSWLP